MDCMCMFPENVWKKSGDLEICQEMLVDRSLIKTGNTIIHKRYGRGVITYVDDRKLCVHFDDIHETKTLSLEYTINNELIENA